jgi:hypothetical protein
MRLLLLLHYRKGLIVSVDDWLRFHTTETVGVVFKHLRQEINQSLLSRIESSAVAGSSSNSSSSSSRSASDDHSSAVMVSLVTRLLDIEAAHTA